jgi:predicted Fe-Mo cluster-binding NifX family protein
LARRLPAKGQPVAEQDRTRRTRIAFPEWDGRISPVFDSAGLVWVLEIVDRREVTRHCVGLARHNPDLRAAQLAQLGVEVLVCGAISQPLQRAMAALGIRVIDGVCGETAAVMDALLNHGRIPPPLRLPGFASNTWGSCSKLDPASSGDRRHACAAARRKRRPATRIRL